MSGFQKQVYVQPSPAVEGDFASANPRQTAMAGPGDFVAGVGGATVGRFGWSDANGLVTNAGAAVPLGFIHRENNALITVFLAESSMVVPDGHQITLFSAGDFWAKTLTVATVGQVVFASNTTGQISTGAAGGTVAGSTEIPNSYVATAGQIGELIKISFHTLKGE